MAQGIVNNGYHIHDERYYTESEIDTKVSELNSSISSEVSARQVADTELQNKINLLTNYVTPEMFGAKGDGVTDDTQAIQQALNLASMYNGTVMFGRNKTYLISKSNSCYVSGGYGPELWPYMLMIKNSMTILGNGATLKRETLTQETYQNPANPAHMIMFSQSEKDSEINGKEINNGNNISIYDLILDGGMTDDIIRKPYSDYPNILNMKTIVIKQPYKVNVVMKNTTVKNCPCEGIYMSDDENSTFNAIGCTFENGLPSVTNIGAKTVKYAGCIFNQNNENCSASEIGLNIFSKTIFSTIIFDSCTFNRDNNYPFITSPKVNSKLIVNNCIFNVNKAGNKQFFTIGCKYANITNCFFYDNFDSLLWVDDSFFNLENADENSTVIFENNYIECKTRRSIWPSNNNKKVISKNNIVLCTKDANSYKNSENTEIFDNFDVVLDGIYSIGNSYEYKGKSAYKFKAFSFPRMIEIIPTNDCIFNYCGGDTAYGGGISSFNPNISLKGGIPFYYYPKISDYTSFDLKEPRINNYGPFIIQCTSEFKMRLFY